MHPIGKDEDHLSLCLKVAGSLPPFGWTKFAYFRLALINQMDSQKSIVRETQQKFNAGYRSWGSSFVHLSDFYNPNQGYLMKNICIIEAHVTVSDVAFNIQDNFTKIAAPSPSHNNDSKAGQTKKEHNQHTNTQLQDDVTECSDETVSPTTQESKWDQASQTESELQPQEDFGTPSEETPSPKPLYFVPTAPPLYPYIHDEGPKEVPLIFLSEVLDIKSLGPEEAAFVPLLEEVCYWHPSLIESQMKKSPKYIHWAFIALGQVLYFLKTTKVKHMDEEACNHLQCLWEELQLFGFNLTWLEPYIQSALDVRAYFEKAKEVKTLNDSVVALEIEMKKLRTKLAVTVIDLEVARRDLAEVLKGLEERDMNAELGFGIS